MNARTKFAAFGTAALVCLGVLLPAAPTFAAGVPATALPSCAGESPETGGWLLRDFVATGTATTDPSPVRPRNARLGEPCFDDDGFADPVLMVPVRLTDIPVDGEWAEAPDGGWERVCGSGAMVDMCIEYMGDAIISGVTQLCFRTTHADGSDRSGVESFPMNVRSVSGAGSGNIFNGSNSSSNSGGSSWVAPCRAAAGLGSPTSWASVNKGANEVATYYVGGSCTTMSPVECGPGAGVVAGGSETYGGTQAADFVFGADSGTYAVPDNGVAVCSTDYSATAPDVVDLPGHIWPASPGNSDTPPTLDGSNEAVDWTVWQGFYPTFGLGVDEVTESNCPYLVSLRFFICAFQGHGPESYGCLEVVWTADRFRERYVYSGENDEESLCALYPDTGGCYEVLNPPVIDGTDFDVVCAGAPEPSWGDWGWIFDWVGHMARCLFVPVNGVDRLHWVEQAWEQSAGGSLSEITEAIGAAFEIDGGCGPIMEGAVLDTTVEIDTCSWTWANQGRMLLYWFIIITGCLAAVGFIFRSVLAVVNTRMPVPLDEDKS